MDAGFRERIEGVSDTRKLIKLAIRELRDQLRATQWVWLCFDQATGETQSLQASSPELRASSDEVAAAIERRSASPDTLCLALLAERRRVDILVLRREGEAFGGRDVQGARALLSVVEEVLRRRRDQRERDVVARAYAHLLRRLRGNDLHYRILHAIRDLVAYDHSAAVFVSESGGELFRLHAEQVAWTKGRSTLIGRPIDLGECLDLVCGSANRPLLFRRSADGPWVNVSAESDPEVETPRAVLEFHDLDGDRPAPDSALIAPLVFEGEAVGVLAAFGLHARSLSERNVETLRSFVPLAAIAVHNHRRDEDLERVLLEQQKRQAVPDIARGVAHDINNALGSMLLRTRALGRDLEASSRPGSALYLEDLRMIEQSASHCRRIFQGLLQFARRGTSDASDVRLDDCVRHVLQIEGSLIEARGLVLELRIGDDLPPVRGQPQQLEQLVHNLLQNARQASRRGDRVLISVRRTGNEVRLTVANGAVIPRDLRARIFEPFFTTRRDSHGLGLALCRAIVVDHGGQLRLRSREGRGTWFQARLPVAQHLRREEGRGR